VVVQRTEIFFPPETMTSSGIIIVMSLCDESFVMFEQDRQNACNSNIYARSREHCCSGKALSITCREYVTVALVYLT